MGAFATPFELSFSLRFRFSREQLVRSPHRVTNNSLRENTIGMASVGVLSFLFLHGCALPFRERQLVKQVNVILGPLF